MGWTPPKGHLHRGESELDGARREALEETSLEEQTGFTFFNNSSQPIFRTSYWDGKRKRIKTSVYFLAEFVPGAQITSAFKQESLQTTCGSPPSLPRHA